MLKTKIRLSVLSLFSLSLALAQPHKGEITDTTKFPLLTGHYQDEYTFDVCTNPGRWQSEPKDLNVSFVTTDRLYFRSEVPDIENKSAAWETSGWRNERLNAQILVWSPDTLNQVRFKISDLKNSSGGVIGKNNISMQLVRYVLSNYPYNESNFGCEPTPYKNVFLMPDRFEAFDRFDVPAKTARPVWLSVNVPASVAGGTYTGVVEVQTEKSKAELQIKIHVQSHVLPGPHEWKYRLDLWQNPWVLAWYNHIEPWSPQHKILLKEHLKLYADAGGKYITTYAVHSPWSDNSYRIEGGMIEWVKRKDNTWHFDYNIFDQYVELAMSVGIDKAITVYTLLPNDNRFRYMDEKTGNYINAKWEPGSAVFNDACSTFLNDLKKHLDKKGWFDKTYLGINESPMEQVLIAIKLIKAQPAKWKITYAGDWHKELSGLLDDYSFVYGYEPNMQEQQQRTASGKTSTLYVCCHPAKPNTLVFSPPVEGRWISWYTAAMGYDGFLRWAYDAWPEDPVRDARHGSWAAGDCFLVYPGANSCIRFEKLREGIVDYEKMRIIRGMATKSTDDNVKKMMNEFDAFLKTFVQERIFKSGSLEEQVKKGKEMMDALSEKLSK